MLELFLNHVFIHTSVGELIVLGLLALFFVVWLAVIFLNALYAFILKIDKLLFKKNKK